MAKNILVISCDVAETRVALIESGIIAELHIERRGGEQPRAGTVGDIYLGKVTRVLPGLQAAFVDIGLERAAFLHVEDLIRPDDFEAYLAGGRKHARDGNGTAAPVHETNGDDEGHGVALPAHTRSVHDGVSGEPSGTEGDAARSPSLDQGDLAVDEADDADPLDDSPRLAFDVGGEDGLPNLSVSAPSMDVGPGSTDDAPTLDRLDDSEDDESPSEPALAAAVATPVGDAQVNPDLDDLFDNPNLPGFTVSDPNDPVPRAPAPRAAGAREAHRNGGSRRGRGRTRDRGHGDRSHGERSARGNDPPRDARPRASIATGKLSKSTPIRDVVKEGQDIIVQLTKEPIGTKGARCSSHISLPGRYVVYLPTLEHVGVSKRIGNEKERARLRETIESMKPPTGGIIVRTLAEGLTKKQLKQDVGYLVRLWGEVAKKREGAKAPATLMTELDIVLKTARDLFTDDVDQLVIDDRGQYDRLCRFVEMFMPERMKDVVFYSGAEPLFDAYGIEDEISRALARKVPLPSGGYLVIDEAEALTAIDVNTGRFVGKGSKDMEETVLKTNLEAVQEIAYQLRFRNIGGLIILDLIDMEKPSNREKVRRTLEELLQRDKAKTTLNRISELGLIEMTRKRTRESLGRLLHEPCFYCDGTGHLQSKETVAYEILREIRRRRQDLPGYTIGVSCHPAVADLLTGGARAAVQEAESRYMRRIHVTPRTEFHLEQFDLSGK
jgi:ribonuclease G